jgi:multiple sugar transport system substrate-binding protein
MATTLRLLARPFQGFEVALQEQIDSFTEATDTDVEIERVHKPLAEIHEELIQDRGFEDGEYDIFLCLSDWLPSMVDKGLVDPITSDVQDAPPEDWPGGWADSMRDLMTYEGEVYGLPYHDGPECFHYRTDLFESVAEQEAFREEYGRPLHVPKTWDEFLNVAEFFTRPDQGLWGTTVAALPDGHNNVYDFLIQLWSRGGGLFDDDMNPTFDDETGVEALQFYHDLIYEYEVAAPESVEMESVEVGQYWAGGNAAMMWNWAGFGAMAEDPDSPVFGDVGYSIIPRADGPEGRHTSLTVIYGNTVLSSSDNKDLAYQFMRHAASPELDKVTTLGGATGCRLSTWSDPEVLQNQSFYAITSEINTGNVNTLPKMPQYTEFNDILNEAVEAVVVEQSESPAEALEEAADRTRELL